MQDKQISNKQIQKIVARYQSINITTLLVICIIMPPIIIMYLQVNLLRIDLVNIVNLVFKCLSLSSTVFIPIVLLDATYFLTLDRNENDFKYIKYLEKKSSAKTIRPVLQMTCLSSFLMMGNIRYWIAELYKEQYYSYGNFMKKVNSIEVCFIILFLALLVIVLLVESILGFTYGKDTSKNKNPLKAISK